MVNFIDRLLSPILAMFKQTMESFIRLETADDEFTLVGDDGSLVSYIKVEGARQIIGDEEYRGIVSQATIKLGARFDRPGHALQFYFSRDPDLAVKQIQSLMRPTRAAAKGTGIDLDDLFDERGRNLARYLAFEEMYLVLWTRPSALTKTDLAREKKASQEKKMGGRAARPNILCVPLNRCAPVIAVLWPRSPAHLTILAFKRARLRCMPPFCVVRASLYPHLRNDRWRACLPGDPIPVRLAKSQKDLSDILWPSLGRQLCIGDAEIITPTMVEIGEMIWSGVDMTLGPMDPSPFPVLLGRLAEANVPFRISYLMESGGAEGMAFKKFAATMMVVTNATNRQVKDSLDGLQALARDQPVVKLRISLSTWAPRDNRKLLEERVGQFDSSLRGMGLCAGIANCR